MVSRLQSLNIMHIPSLHPVLLLVYNDPPVLIIRGHAVNLHPLHLIGCRIHLFRNVLLLNHILFFPMVLHLLQRLALVLILPTWKTASLLSVQLS